MREILFRGKKENGRWVWGFYKINLTGKCQIANGELYWHNIIPETVGQYTGLTDKNGKKIFEGDVVHLTDVRYENEWEAVVEFGNPYSQYSWGWNLRYIGKKPQVNTDILLWVEMEEIQVFCEVIGNIHDNPELLKGGAE